MPTQRPPSKDRFRTNTSSPAAARPLAVDALPVPPTWLAALLLGPVAFSVACSSGASGAASDSAEQQAAAAATAGGGRPIKVRGLELGEGVQAMELSCKPDAEELCNALDDNCNGQIDEGCGYKSGPIQITVAWNSDADIDLYVTDPIGETLSHAHKQTPSGGVLDHDARGACQPPVPNNRIENLYWSTQRPPSGRYEVAVRYYGECNTAAGPTTVTTSVAVGGRVLGSYNHTLSPTQSVTIATFEIPKQ